MLTLGDLKGGELPNLINLCPDDPRFLKKVNRASEFLIQCGSFWGTNRKAHLCVSDCCIVIPGYIATIEAVRNCDRAVHIDNNWNRMLPGNGPSGCCGTQQFDFAYVDNVPSFRQLCAPRVLRSYASSTGDYGKTIKFLGWDKNRIWVRTRQNGLMKDGEVVTLVSPFVDTVTEWSSVTAVILQEAESVRRVFSHPIGSDVLTPFGVYEYYETKPSYQRFRLNQRNGISGTCGTCCTSDTVEAEIKIAFIPVKYDEDLLPVGNRIGMELAVMGVKALDDGDIARADVLLFGSRENKRIGAIPMLNQEIQTNTADRFASSVQIGGPCGFRSLMRGFI